MAGRPKTLDRDHALGVALEGYWREGYFGMSLNEVCRRAKISKPGLYREFGGEDGLLSSVLKLYGDVIVKAVLKLLKAEHSFEAVLRLYLENTITRNGHPPGCLMAELLLTYPELGEATRIELDKQQALLLEAYREWIIGAQTRGEIANDLDPDIAARHLFTQMNMASVDALRGGDAGEIRRRVSLALWCFKPGLAL
jgi:AcrR family transcriptional regulator